MPHPVAVLVAAPPARPDVLRLVLRAVRGARGATVPVLLVGAGVGWADDATLCAWSADGRVATALCSRSAGERGLSAAATPTVRWSSLVGWIAALPEGCSLWTALP